VRSRTPALQLLASGAVAAAIHVLAFTPGPFARMDALALGLGPLDGSTTAIRLATALADTFDPLPYALLLLAVVAAAVLHHRARAGALASAVMLGAPITTEILKRLLAHPRSADAPYLPPDAWPSGHTTAAAAFAIALVLVTPPPHRRRVIAAGLVLVVAVGIALVALRSHFPSDVLGGLCVAAAWGVAAFALERPGAGVSPAARSPRDAGGRRVPS
jgi:membrane-associated phospholipid phosphatase